LTNSGEYDSEEVAQIYIEYPESAYGIKYQLVDFRRLFIKKLESKVIDFHIEPEKLLVCNFDGEYVFHPGKYRLIVGGCGPGEEGVKKGAPKHVDLEFIIE